jgi:predicted polyphosphate/ATP-dependent NAD kinase
VGCNTAATLVWGTAKRCNGCVSAVTSAQLPVVPGSTVGILANPMSGRDIRRLVAQASVFPNAEKTNMVLRLLAAAGGAGVERALVSTDGMGVAGGVARAVAKRRASDGRLPALEFVELEVLSGTADDTHALVRAMRAAGAAVIVVLGGDGTARAAAADSGDVALLPLSTGTNNAFPEMWEATVAGTAAALLATGRVPAGEITHRCKALHVRAGDAHEIALVDVCVTTVAHVAAKALWQPATLRELYCTFAEPHAIGLSSIAGLLHPVARTDSHGVAVRMGPGCTVLAPVAPGVVVPVEVAEVAPLAIGDTRLVAQPRGTVAVDGEREIAFGPATPVTVTLGHDGPRVLDVRAALAAAAAERLLVREPTLQEVR